MLFKIECQYCGLQAQLSSWTLTANKGTIDPAQLPVGWTADALMADGQEAWTLCPDHTALWKQWQHDQRTMFAAEAPVLTAPAPRVG